jgi:hypothetical protein
MTRGHPLFATVVVLTAGVALCAWAVGATPLMAVMALLIGILAAFAFGREVDEKIHHHRRATESSQERPAASAGPDWLGRPDQVRGAQRGGRSRPRSIRS